VNENLLKIEADIRQCFVLNYCQAGNNSRNNKRTNKVTPMDE
jgi:hypothetical protein